MSGQAKRRRRWSPTLAEKTARVGYPLFFRDQSLYNFSRARDCFCPSEADLVPAPPFTLGDGRNSRSLISSLRLRMPRPLLAHWRPVCDPAQIRVVHPPAEESPRDATEFPFARAQVCFLFPSAIHVCLSWISRCVLLPWGIDRDRLSALLLSLKRNNYRSITDAVSLAAFSGYSMPV